MKKAKVFKIISIISYLSIILKGQIIGLPFVFWILITVADLSNNDQGFAFLAILGLALICIIFNSKRTIKVLLIDLLSFLLLASPIISRMTTAPVVLFNYWTFIIPASMFVLFYSFSFFTSTKQYFKNQSEVK